MVDYAAPDLIDLNDSAFGYGGPGVASCHANGSSATDCKTYGNQAVQNCNTGSTAYKAGCKTGTSAGADCSSVGSSAGGTCRQGSAAAPK